MDELLRHYESELQFIRQVGTEFAKTYPKVAGRLRWSGDTSEDPHVSRMIEAFALLNARTRHKIDDEFPEVSESLLNILYPHYLAPIPSSTIIQCQLDKNQAELLQGYKIERGTTVETEPIDGQPCRFRTCFDNVIWPVAVESAEIQGAPFNAPPTMVSRTASAVIRIRLKTLSPKVKFNQLEMRDLRFHLHGEGKHKFDLYELILKGSIGVAYCSPDTVERFKFVKQAVKPVGFDRDQGLIDYPARSFMGYRLLTEFFSLPEKFMFFDVDGITPETLEVVGESDRMDIYIFLDEHQVELEQLDLKETLLTGCTPIVNLYKRRAEPVRLTQTQTDYRIVPDARRPFAHEIYSIDRVIGTSPRNEEVEFLPFYATQHHRKESADGYWCASRRQAGYVDGRVDYGTEMHLSIVDLDFQPSSVADWTIDIETTCLNRDLASRLFEIGSPQMRFSGQASLAKIHCLNAPTPTLRPPLRRGTVWRLISHLSLNHLSLADTENGADAIREILSLYDFTDSRETKAMIAGLRNISCRPAVGRVQGGVAAGFCRGVEISLNLDEDRFTGSSLYLFAAILERFLALYCTVNTFTKTVVTTNNQTTPRCSWPPRAGEQILI